MNKDNMNILISANEENVQYVKSITDKIVNTYTGSLDDTMECIYNEIVRVEDPSILTIEKYFVELSNVLYFVSSKVEELSIYDGISKASMQEAYNTKYLECQNTIGSSNKKPTIAEASAEAENAVVDNTAVNLIYSRAYKIVKSKVDVAQTMISTLNQLLRRRISEMNLIGNNMDADKIGSRKILNEGGN